MSIDASQPLVVLITAPDRNEANRIAQMLVDLRLAACVQILPEMRSVYRWKGNVESTTEVLLLAKTTAEKFEELDRKVREVHSYETPEIVALSITASSEPYLRWLISEL